MSDQENNMDVLVSEGGILAAHPSVQVPVLPVAPSDAREHNTIIARLIPVACWRIGDLRFEFDSSIVRPEIEAEFKKLAKLLRRNLPPSKRKPSPGCPLSVFGHADPTGNDDYNKMLSGRRAKAIYALLTRRTDLWEQLYSEPFGNDKWKPTALQVMLDFVSPSSSPKTRSDLVASHDRDATKRKALFSAYMEKLAGGELDLKKEDFLGHGDDAGGKGDFQGCGEFNPLLIFSQEKQNQFERAEDKSGRDAENTPNRRVMVLIFRKGSRVIPTKWPCPRVSEGVAGCRKRFWSDGEKRRNTRRATESREFQKTNDTFACRFYHRLTVESPCEKLLRGPLKIWLHDNFGQRMPAGTPYRITAGSQVRSSELKRVGFLVEEDIVLTERVKVEWGDPKHESAKRDSLDDRMRRKIVKDEKAHPFLEGTTVKASKSAFRFRADLLLDRVPADTVGEARAKRRLQNLGYSADESLDDSLRLLEGDYALKPDDVQNRKVTLRDLHRDGIEVPLLRNAAANEEPLELLCSNQPLDDTGNPVVAT